MVVKARSCTLLLHCRYAAVMRIRVPHSPTCSVRRKPGQRKVDRPLDIDNVLLCN